MLAQTYRILLIDDDEDSYSITKGLLRQISQGYELDWIDNFEDGLVAVCNGTFHACLLDYRLGSRDGIDLLRSAISSSSLTPIIMLTGQTDRKIDMEAMKAGAADYLVKDGLTPELLERVLRYTIERHRVNLGFRVAEAIQQRLLPQSAPELPGYNIAGVCHPAEATGGDFFDFVPMQDGTIGLLVADVSSHGFGSALIMAETRRVIRTLARVHCDLGTIMRITHEAILEDTAPELFVTLFFVQLDPKTGMMHYIGAGHEAYLLGNGGTLRHLATTALPLGLTEESEFAVEGPVGLAPGQLLFMYTDGLTEAMDPNGEPFGIDRTLDLVQQFRHLTAAVMLERLHQAVMEFCLPNLPKDDVSAVIVKAS